MAIRSLVQHLNPDPASELPGWATAPISDTQLALVNSAGAAADWPALRTVIEEHTDVLLARATRAALGALTYLVPDHRAAHLLLDLLDEIAAVGLPATLQDHQHDHDRLSLLLEWMRTPSWEASFAFHHEHQASLATAEVRAQLADLDDDTARQHKAILDLTDMFALDSVYAVVTDPNAAEEAALDSIENGRLDQLAPLATASTSLHRREPTMALLAAVLMLADGQPAEAKELIQQIAEHIESTQRRAYVVHLRGLEGHYPDLQGIDDLIATLSNFTEADGG